MKTIDQVPVIELGKASRETKAPGGFGAPELGNPLYAYRG